MIPLIGDEISIDDTKYPDNADNTTEEIEQNKNTVMPAYRSIRTKRKMGWNIYVLSDYITKTSNNKNQKYSITIQKSRSFTCMKEYVIDVKSDFNIFQWYCMY